MLDGQNQEVFVLEETIKVPDKDMSPSEMAVIMKQVAKVCNFLGGNIMRAGALDKSGRGVGAGHPICQAILAAAAQADMAAANLSAPSQITTVGAIPAQAMRRPS